MIQKLLVSLTTSKAIIFIAAIGFIVFFNALFNGFVGDDFNQIVDNKLVHSVVNIPAFFTTSTFDFGNGSTGVYYKPLLTTTFSIIYSFFGQNTFFFHLPLVIIHIINSVLLLFLFRKFINKEWAFLLTIIFLVHPLNQDVAAYIANTQDALFFLFGIVALLISTSKINKYLNLKVFLMLALSLLSKETAIAFILINFFYVFLFRRERLKETIVYSLILVISYSLVHYLVVGMNFAIPNYYHISRLSLFERTMNIPKVIYFYLQTFIFPNKLAVIYDWTVTTFNYSDFYIPLATIVLFFGIIVFFGKIIKYKNIKQFYAFILFVFWLGIGLSFHLQIVPLDGTVAPRWFYLPMAGLLGLIGVILQNFVTNTKIKAVVYIFFLIVIMIFSVMTFIRNADFKNNLILMCHDANESHTTFSLEYACGGSLFLAGSYNEAQTYFERTVKLAPYYGWFGLGSLYQKDAEMHKDSKMLIKAEDAYKTALKNEPNNPQSYEGLGGIYTFDSKNIDNAKNFLEESLRIFPGDYLLWKYLAVVEYKSGDNQSASQDIKNAYMLNPNDTEVKSFYYNLVNNVPINFRQFDFE